MEPDAEAKVPAEHLAHALAPGNDVYAPATQLKQVPDDAM
jgi:hypothetical protein